MHYVFARIIVKPEVADLAKRLLLDLVSKSRQDEGCMAYELFQQTAAPHVFQTVEQWRDKADAEAHMKSLHVGAALAAAGPLLAAAPEIVAYSRLA
ncbi:putative quinol monooxygenase [Variovorax sp. DT-64]|uniref:putative quinol monooxygenase n=1 Tax=Variovorax sp. DT-64 TaxID=3396160 RepID=UPI003F19F8AE